MYFLVQLHDVDGALPARAPDHEPFVEQLIARNVALVGGRFSIAPQPGVQAAYVLRCASIEEARTIVADDPYLTAGVATATVVPWEIVAINPAAIDEALTFRPEDIPRSRHG